MTKDANKKNRNYSLRINDELHKELAKEAEKYNTTKSDVIKRILVDHLTKEVIEWKTLTTFHTIATLEVTLK